MIPVRVNKVGKVFEVETKYGTKTKRMVEVTRLDAEGGELKVGLWWKEDYQLDAGEEVLMDITKSGDYYNAGKFTSFASRDIQEKTQELKEEIAPKKDFKAGEQKMWDDKETRMNKGKCVMYALETLKMTYPNKINDQTLADTEGEVANMVKMLAMNYYDWMYEKSDPNEEIAF